MALRVGFMGLFGELVVDYIGLYLGLSGPDNGPVVGLLLLYWRERIIGACTGSLFP